MGFSDRPEPKALHQPWNIKAAVVLGMLVGACERPPGAPDPQAATPRCLPGGHLTASVYGSLEGRLDWQEGELVCEGMPRPRGEGARLRFEGPATDSSSVDRLAFIIALPDLAEGRTAAELPAGVTLMEVNAGRFFSSPEQAGCWADIEQQESIADVNTDAYRISGLLYCVSPLGEVNGSTSVSLRDLRFTGKVDWSEPK
jgi:hypothetical protein